MARDQEQVLSKAADLLTRRPTASMDDIARAAGISRATLHRQFAGRDALVRALEQLGIRRLAAVLDAARIEEGDAEGALRRVVSEAEGVAGFLGFLLSESQLFEPGRGLDEGWRRIDARITALFRRGQEQGAFRIDMTAVWMTEALYALITASAWAVQDGRVAARDAGRMISELLLGGARRPRTPGPARDAPAVGPDAAAPDRHAPTPTDHPYAHSEERER